jgi:hypothetical protein
MIAGSISAICGNTTVIDKPTGEPATSAMTLVSLASRKADGPLTAAIAIIAAMIEVIKKATNEAPITGGIGQTRLTRSSLLRG